ncbi:DNA binding methylated-DNA--cysteine S-methyltransferase [Violaceomyces palustris]|uniref:DNA binding methylated-DNA--cysteine S-methyltransferase n=1 Tax=Violaceomyces palustris TaxID=1673888 RepID=A0ACD0P4Y9_9BASI|nr:DNA binding methylated-DNA--cysteine S-methyltransferase [Violaceomyces palustris]
MTTTNSRVNPEEFHARVYEICRLIPRGKVTTYGHIAKLAGHPSHSRLVGSALKFLGDPSVPWQRVISSSGAISDRGDGGEGARRQAERLVEEGVEVIEMMGGGVNVGGNRLSGPADRAHVGGGRWRVNFSNARGFGWFPDSVHLEMDEDAVQIEGSEEGSDEGNVSNDDGRQSRQDPPELNGEGGRGTEDTEERERRLDGVAARLEVKEEDDWDQDLTDDSGRAGPSRQTRIKRETRHDIEEEPIAASASQEDSGLRRSARLKRNMGAQVKPEPR